MPMYLSRTMIIDIIKIVLVSVLLSVLITLTLMFALIEDLTMFSTSQLLGLTVSVLVPLIVATPASYYVLLQKEKLNLAYQELDFLLRYDPLTSLLTRRTFLKEASLALSHCKANNENYAVFYIDIDHFKKINDSCGHIIGDKTLELFGQTLSSILVHDELAGRLGGEEFCIFAPGYDNTTIQTVANQILEQFQRRAKIIDTIEVNGTASIGVASSMSESLEELIHEADIQLYNAKKTGRNKFSYEEIA